jgi:hypothetical protein
MAVARASEKVSIARELPAANRAGRSREAFDKKALPREQVSSAMAPDGKMRFVLWE